jgi:glycerate kinase
LLEGCPIVPSRTLLVAATAFGERLSSRRVAAAVAAGLLEGGWQSDPCPLDPPTRDRSPSGATRELLDALDFDVRMRSARALIVCERRLHEDTLTGSIAFEIATRARQAGVPAYAVTADDRLDSFDARILDLQAIVEAKGARSLQGAGRKLAELI